MRWQSKLNSVIYYYFALLCVPGFMSSLEFVSVPLKILCQLNHILWHCSPSVSRQCRNSPIKQLIHGKESHICFRPLCSTVIACLLREKTTHADGKVAQMVTFLAFWRVTQRMEHCKSTLFKQQYQHIAIPSVIFNALSLCAFIFSQWK